MREMCVFFRHYMYSYFFLVVGAGHVVAMHYVAVAGRCFPSFFFFLNFISITVQHISSNVLYAVSYTHLTLPTTASV